MALEGAAAFAGRETYQEALLDYAHTLEEPISFHAWWPMARELRQFYEDAPERLWSHAGDAYSVLRHATFVVRFGEGYAARVVDPRQARLRALLATGGHAGAGTSGAAGSNGTDAAAATVSDGAAPQGERHLPKP